MSEHHLSVREARAQLADAISRAGAGQTTVITRHARPAAALVPIALLEHYQRLRRAELVRLVEARNLEPACTLAEVHAALWQRRNRELVAGVDRTVHWRPSIGGVTRTPGRERSALS
ncbi:hypothetical protein GCM10010441_77540 [Kitasatospora paracochleata]|uniref:Antitoxin n=1 Tax=Kitasatospora paracochleata TaxID=58354 RepID=A0ABT1JAB5_9ACTN|nr:type II toxin-antitoxin system prevent-host-death family antitoxin [Kitasatospora paracochleata]MCP2314008.1 prevent-host-death family protein [Kitasatospora paracochleata]